VGFRRQIQPSEPLLGATLGRAMAGIGMAVVSDADYAANIEDTLLAMSVEGMERDHLRELSLLTMWWSMHGPFVNADRLLVLVKQETSPRVRAYWASLALMRRTDPRFARFRTLVPEGESHSLLRVGNDFQLARRGEDQRFVGAPLRVPQGTLRERAADVLPPQELAKRHRAYRARVLMGPSYRADMWAALELEPTLGVAELARRTYGSIATASRVKRDRVLWLASG
jgi:hypothetical protein